MADDVTGTPANRLAEEPSPGERLRAARNEKRLDTKEIAATLHVDPWMLDALEHDEYGALGAPVFAKGHLRKYATVLGIDPDELLVGYYQRVSNRDTPPLVAESILRVEAAQRSRFGWLLPVIIAACVFGLVAFGAVLYLRTDSGPAPARAAPVDDPQRSSADARSTRLALPGTDTRRNGAPARRPALVATLPPATAPTEVAPTERGAEPAVPPVTPAAATRVTPPPAGTRVAAATPAASVPVADSGTANADADQVTLMLRFDEASWVEVYDRDRAKLLYGMGQAGKTQYLSGPPPLQVFLGKSSGVVLAVDGEPFDIPRGRRRGNTARFVVEKPTP